MQCERQVADRSLFAVRVPYSRYVLLALESSRAAVIWSDHTLLHSARTQVTCPNLSNGVDHGHICRMAAECIRVCSVESVCRVPPPRNLYWKISVRSPKIQVDIGSSASPSSKRGGSLRRACGNSNCTLESLACLSELRTVRGSTM